MPVVPYLQMYFLLVSSPACDRPTYLTSHVVSDLLKAGPKLLPKVMKYSRQSLALTEGLVSLCPLAPLRSGGNSVLLHHHFKVCSLKSHKSKDQILDNGNSETVIVFG